MSYRIAITQNSTKDEKKKPKKKPSKGINRRLFKAVIKNDLITLEKLLKMGEAGGIYVNGTSNRGHSPIYLACKYGREEALNLLIKYGGGVPAIQNTFGTTPLHAAIEGGHEPIVQVLLKHNVRIFGKDANGKTPLDRLRS